MSKVFRLYSEGATTYQGWNENPSFPYNFTARETIADPDGASAKNEITSIPSPFARIDLVKTAFKEVCRRANANIKELDGNTIFHKMVSDTLDVGEIFFNIDRFSDKVEIITCDCSIMLQNLKNDNNSSHYYVADSLEKFLGSDAKTYNFAQMNNIYLLNYTKGPDELNIIGATSPATLFFCGANKLDYINDIFFADNDKPFDNEYQPLYKRDFEYLKAWWTLRNTNANFSSLFPEIDEYLTLTYRAISDITKKNQLSTITSQALNDYSAIDVRGDSQSDQVEVIGINLLKKRNGITDTASEFTIKPVTQDLSELPLVLPVDSGNKYASLKYVNGAWGKTNKVPFKDDNDLQSRFLPFDGSQYPYLTISDFLEDCIIRVPHALNGKDYFDGNIRDNKERKSYLLPIKPLYFKYFDIDLLKSTMSDGKAAFEMTVLAGGSINVVLRIPILGNGKINYIEYERTYYASRQPSIDSNNNDGGMTDLDFTGFVMPAVKFQQESEAYYTVSCVTSFSTRAKVFFYANENVIRDIPMDCRNQQQGVYGYKAETYTLDKKNFDYLRIVCANEQSGLLVPAFLSQHGYDVFEFAVDLGTSNTHIEMKKVGENNSVPFACDESDEIISKFFIPLCINTEEQQIQVELINETNLMNVDFIPSVIGKGSDYSFPTRTVLSCAKNVNWNEALRVLGLLNLNMTYNKKKRLLYNAEPLVNIKWSNDANAQAAMELYIENLLLIIRNKVAVTNGNIQQTKITWFYPNSMSMRRLSQLRNAWNRAYTKLFSTSENVFDQSESIAPIQYYFSRYATVTNLINIDIGGGTTDIAFSDGGDVKYITSFRFAANSLFEDSFSNINPNNGIIDWFKTDILELLKTIEEKGNSDLKVIFNESKRCSDMASFLFSLKDNSATKAIASNKIDFDVVLQNDDKFKIVFIIFYTAIIYHTAQIIKAKKLELPRHITFSGNGSKILKVLASDSKIIANYTKIVFEKILGKHYENTLEILGLDNTSVPKESTSKGGLLPTKQRTTPENIILKDSSGELVCNNDTYLSLNDDAKKHIVDSVERFFHFTLVEMPSEFNFDDNFGVSLITIDLAKEECSKDLSTYLDKGIELSKLESGSQTNKIEDALSFYPIKGVLQALSTRIEQHFRTH
jgi:hypothetical protein